MPSIKDVFLDFILPALIVAGGMVLGWWRRGRDGRWIGAITIAGAFAAAECAIGGAPRAPGVGDAAFWLIWFMIPLGLLGLLDALFRPPTWLRAGIFLMVARLGVRLLVAPLATHKGASAADNWNLEFDVDWLGMIVVLWWLAIEKIAERSPGATAPALLAVVAAGAAAILGSNYNVKASQGAAALAGMASVAAVLAWPVRSLSLARGANLVFAGSLLGLLIYVRLYSDLPPATYGFLALLLSSPLLWWLGDLPGVRGAPPRHRLAVRLVPVLLAVGVAAGLSVHRYLHPPPGAKSTSTEQEEY